MSNGIRIDHGCKIDGSAVIGTEPFALLKVRLKGIRVRKEGKAGIWVKPFVTMGAHSSIQKGLTQPTTIGEHGHLSDGVRIGHDAQIGKNCQIGINTTISGYTILGDNVKIDPGCAISNRLTIGDGARVRIGSLVLSDIPPGGDYAGRPAIPFDEFKRQRKRMKELLKE